MSDLVERLARSIYAKRPDCQGKPWPLETDDQRRAYPHNPIAAVDLSFIYAAPLSQKYRQQAMPWCRNARCQNGVPT